MLEGGTARRHPLSLARACVGHRQCRTTGRGDARRLIDAANQTTSVTPVGGSAVTMGYTGASQVQRVSAGGTGFQDGLLGLNRQSDSGGMTYYTRGPQGELLGQRTPAGRYYYLYDGLGSTAVLTDSAGAVVLQSRKFRRSQRAAYPELRRVYRRRGCNGGLLLRWWPGGEGVRRPRESVAIRVHGRRLAGAGRPRRYQRPHRCCFERLATSTAKRKCVPGYGRLAGLSVAAAAAAAHPQEARCSPALLRSPSSCPPPSGRC